MKLSCLLCLLPFLCVDGATTHVQIVLTSQGKTYNVAASNGQSKTSSMIPYKSLDHKVFMKYQSGTGSTVHKDSKRVQMNWDTLFAGV